MHKSAIYIRWSTEDQGQGTTLQVQSEACRRYCDQQGWYVPDDLVFVDDGYSGGTLHRPALSKLRQMVEKGLVGTVVVYRLDRLSRNLADAAALVDKEFKNRAVVRSATEDVKPEADEGWLNYSFRAAFADYERRVIRQRTMAGKLKRLQEGRKVAGKAPYGWRKTATPGVLEIDPDQARVVRQLFEKCAHENMGCPSLARWANAEGYPAPRAAKWESQNLRKLLTNPVYGGRIVFGQYKFLKANKEDPGPWRRAQAPVVDVEADPKSLPPIIPRELWEMAQLTLQRRAENVVKGRGVSNPHLLSGLLYCRCGGRMGPKARGRARRQTGHGDFYYRCYNSEAVEPCALNPAYIEAGLLEQEVEAALLAHARAPGLRENLAWRLQEQQDDSASLLTAELRRVEDEMAQLEKELAFVDRQFRRQLITIEEARRLRAGVDGEMGTLREREAELRGKAESARRSQIDGAVMKRQFDLVRQWERLTVLEKKEVMRHFIQRIEAFRPRGGTVAELIIDWHLAPPSEVRINQPLRRSGRDHETGTK